MSEWWLVLMIPVVIVVPILVGRVNLEPGRRNEFLGGVFMGACLGMIGGRTHWAILPVDLA